MKTFRAPWGWALLLVSISTSVVLLLLALIWRSSVHPQSIVETFLFVFFFLWLTALFTIRGYTVTPEAILVHRLFWSTRLPREGLVSAVAQPQALQGSLRICGNGGMFSFTGWFWSKKLGRFRAYVTDLNRTVVLRYAKRTAVVSPDDPEGFVRELMG